MEIKIIAEASKKLDKNDNNWGLSFLIDNDILFDTFSNEKIIIKNFKKLKIDIKQIKYVVISHDHWDHTGGLWWLLEQNKNIQLFIPEGFSGETIEKIKKHKVDFIEVKKITEIKKDFFIFGPIKGKYKDKIIYEQVLIVKKRTEKQSQNIVITGCSHPGIIYILNQITNYFSSQFYLILGGMHLKNKKNEYLKTIIDQLKNNYNIQKIAPCHCTGDRAVKLIKKEFKNRYIKISSKKILKI